MTDEPDPRDYGMLIVIALVALIIFIALLATLYFSDSGRY